MFQLAKQLVLSGKESKARIERKVLCNTKSMQLDLEAVHRNAYIRVSGNIHRQREEEEMTSRNDLKGTKKNMSNNLSGQLLLPDEKSSFCIGCAL